MGIDHEAIRLGQREMTVATAQLHPLVRPAAISSNRAAPKTSTFPTLLHSLDGRRGCI
jgi:hypothetical protein